MLRRPHSESRMEVDLVLNLTPPSRLVPNRRACIQTSAPILWVTHDYPTPFDLVFIFESNFRLCSCWVNNDTWFSNKITCIWTGVPRGHIFQYNDLGKQISLHLHLPSILLHYKMHKTIDKRHGSVSRNNLEDTSPSYEHKISSTAWTFHWRMERRPIWRSVWVSCNRPDSNRETTVNLVYKRQLYKEQSDIRDTSLIPIVKINANFFGYKGNRI